MIYIRGEGEDRRNGLNFYPLNDSYSAGFVLRTGHYALRVRYRKRVLPGARRWVIGWGKY